MAFQYILYFDLHPRSNRKSKVKVGFQQVKGPVSICTVYNMIGTLLDGCMNVILQKFTRNWTKVECDFWQKSRVKAEFLSLTTLTEDEDWSTMYIGVPPPCRMKVVIKQRPENSIRQPLIGEDYHRLDFVWICGLLQVLLLCYKHFLSRYQ